MGTSKVTYAPHAWNPVTGCTPVSRGCDHCYARREHERRHRGNYKKSKRPPQYEQPFDVIQTHPGRLDEPARRRRPTLYFVCNGSDLFHPCLPGVFRRLVYRAMLTVRRHTYLVLTKRPAQMVSMRLAPMPHIYHGTSVEDAWSAEIRLASLRNMAGPRWLSVEPLLEQVVLGEAVAWLDWVVVGCESGPGHRPMELDWVRSIRDECLQRAVPFYFKQAFTDGLLIEQPLLDGRRWLDTPFDESVLDGQRLVADTI